MSRGSRWVALFAITGLVLSSCTHELARPEPGPPLPIPLGVAAPELVVESTTEGEWVGGALDHDGRVQAISDVGGKPIALVVGKSTRRGEFRLYEMRGDGAQLLVDWMSHPDAPLAAQNWRSVVGLDGVNGSIVVANREGSSAPMSTVLETDEEPTFSKVGSGAGTAKITKAQSSGKTIIAIGSVRGTPAVWQSTEGLEWQPVPLPALFPNGGVVSDVAFAKGRWVITAHSKGGTHALFALSSDDGLHWDANSLTSPDSPYPTNLKAVAHDGTSFVAVGLVGYATESMRRDVMWTSPDGVSWGPPKGPDTAAFGDGRVTIPTSTTSLGASVITGTGTYHADANYCYDDPATCQLEYRAVWLATDGRWRRLAGPSGLEATGAAAINDVLYVGGRIEDGIGLFEWRAETSGDLPFAGPYDADPPVSQLEVVGWHAQLDEGVVYGFPSYGAICAAFNGLWWTTDVIESDAGEKIEQSTAVAGGRLYGTIELIAPDRIEYAIPGHGPIAHLRVLGVDDGSRGCSL